MLASSTPSVSFNPQISMEGDAKGYAYSPEGQTTTQSLEYMPQNESTAFSHEGSASIHSPPRYSSNPSVDWSNAKAGTVPVKNMKLNQVDEEARLRALEQPGYCVDELCACTKHQCIPPTRPVPFTSTTTYRTEYVNRIDPNEQQLAKRLILDNNGIPVGVDPAKWKAYVAKEGYPANGQIPAYLYYVSSAETRDFTTEQRRSYTPKDITSHQDFLNGIYGPDGVPKGVDPTVWQAYINQHGVPPQGKIPAHLYYTKTNESRDFNTESRSQYNKKGISVFSDTVNSLYGPDGVPHGVDKAAWEAYVAKHGVPPVGKIPAQLYYTQPAETRDFATSYRANYKANVITTCPLNKLPPYPTPQWPREHTFWDPVAKKWY